MFQTVPLSIIRSFLLYTQQWYMSYRFADSMQAGSGQSSVLILLTSRQQTCMTYTIAMCTVLHSWWWTQELSETCRVYSKNKFWDISASSWFYYKNLGTCHSMWQVFLCLHHSPRLPARLTPPPVQRPSLLHHSWKSPPPKNSFSVGNKWKITWVQVWTTRYMLECVPAQALCANGL